MSTGLAFLVGMFGGITGEVVGLRTYRMRVFDEWPEALRQPAYYVFSVLYVVIGGGVAVVHAMSVDNLTAVLAWNVGITGPWLGERILDRTLPKPELPAD